MYKSNVRNQEKLQQRMQLRQLTMLVNVIWLKAQLKVPTLIVCWQENGITASANETESEIEGAIIIVVSKKVSSLCPKDCPMV